MAFEHIPPLETTSYNMLTAQRYRAQWQRINDTIGVGLIAPKDIQAGEVIFVENGAVFLQAPEEKEVRPWTGLAYLDEEEFNNYILRLITQAELRAQLIEEFIGDGTVEGLDYPEDAEDCLHRPAYPEAIISWERFDKIWQKSEVLENLLDQEASWNLMGRFFNDTVFVPDHNGQVQHALGLLTSLMNHSCSPNATMFFDGYNKPIDEDNPIVQIRMQAVKDIKAGEEITRSYLTGAGTLQEHMDMLRIHYGFHCRCSACLDAEEDPLISDLRYTVFDLKVEFENKEDVLSYPQLYRCAALLLDGYDALGIAHATISEIYRALYTLAFRHSDAIRAHYFIHKSLQWYGEYTFGDHARELAHLMGKVLENNTQEYAWSIKGYSYFEDFDLKQTELEELMFMMRHRPNDHTYYCLQIVDGTVEELSERVNRLVQERGAEALLRLSQFKAVQEKSTEQIVQEKSAEQIAQEQAQRKSVEELAREIEGVSEDVPPKHKKSKSKKKKKKTATSTEQGGSSTNPRNSTAEQGGAEKPPVNAVEHTPNKEVAESDSPDVVVDEIEGVAEETEPKSPATRQQESEVKTPRTESSTNTVITNDIADARNRRQGTNDKTATEKQGLRILDSAATPNEPNPTLGASETNSSVVAPNTVMLPTSTQARKETPSIRQPLIEPALPRSLTISASPTFKPEVDPPMLANPLYSQEGEGWDTAVPRRAQKQQAKLRRPAPGPVRDEVLTPHFTRPAETPRDRGTPTKRVRRQNRGDRQRVRALEERVKELESRNAFLEAVAGIVTEEDALAESWVSPFGAKDGVSKQAWLASDGSKEALRLNPRDVGHLLAAKDGIGARLDGFVLRARRDSACGRLQGDKDFVDRGRLRAHSFGNDASKGDVFKLAEVRESREF
ncbi:hypothetical protein LTR10_012654 [Elasticomyces elasticus]|uniref:SET domain-containing protein n=1 Tax=Exophiala sideris TaxID=1016849 RepID=A0ABR0JRT7_9EURO|nr:hypothetical protein LTR10_012654 [Elasticomyces elasticus]KAK5040146.1 hypothetical protein LTS07_000643 [Exophiala sideris]KAK5043429.1 hypothetical protein LTR13_001200 [Exophiala sideris]KAK5068524.1 hypothetical protein LTR69_000644 [Exophiala sideris]KAK5186122.1 hypothetical protein LTR44_001177 [Eurotiomycetes sp. CCFEE 6388]